MPSLFDSHDEFNEWFSKDIETAAENKGSKLNERQLRRLHMILKPFMLRRVKRHVQNELSEKARQITTFAKLVTNACHRLRKKSTSISVPASVLSMPPFFPTFPFRISLRRHQISGMQIQLVH